MKQLGARETRALLDQYGLRPKTSIGQHFLIDPNTARKVVSIAAFEPGSLVLEVGPGLGALTVALLDAGARVVAIERDRELEPVLSSVAPDVKVVWEDAMRANVRRLVGRGPSVMVSNLPYQIATPLVVGLLETVPAITSYTVMVQREVGERLVAAPGAEAYGGVSAKIAYFATARIATRISRTVFYPVPDVESVIVRIDRRPAPAVKGARARIFAVIDAGFAQRRKTIRRALRGGGWTAEDVERALRKAGVDGGARAETLSVEHFAALARALPKKP